MSYLLDTDIVIDYLRGKKIVVKSLEKLFESKAHFYISIITLAEYYHGAYASSKTNEELKLFHQFLDLLGIETVRIDFAIAEEYGKIQGALQKEGQLGSGFDMLIAATCLVHRLTLITDNKKHFNRVKELTILG